MAATQSVTYTSDGDVKTISGPVQGMMTTSIHDALRRVIGVVGPGANASGNYPASNFIYDGNGRLQTQQQGTSDSAGTTFSALATTTNGYDAGGRRTSMTVSGSAQASAVNFGYDAADRPTTTTVLMSNQGANRTTTNAYDGNGLLSTVTTASGMANPSTITYGYDTRPNNNGRLVSIKDGKLNTTTYDYDGFDRLNSTTFADGTHEQLTYDANSNVLTHALRDNVTTITYSYDTINQVKTRSGQGQGASVSNAYTYDGLGRLTSATGGSYNVSRTYDALGNMLTDSTGGLPIANTYDAAGERVREQWVGTPDSIKFQYSLSGTMSAITDDNGGHWATFSYDDLGRRTHVYYDLNLRSTDYVYGPDLRLSTLTHRMTGGTGNGKNNNVTYSYSYNPAGQITQRTTSNDSYVYHTVPKDVSLGTDLLNQLETLPSPQTPFYYDARGNQTGVTAPVPTTNMFRVDDKPVSLARGSNPTDILTYDALDRLASIQAGSGGSVTRLVWDGNELAGEYDASGNVQNVYARGPGSDEPMVWYNGSTVQIFHADERGSIVALTDRSGNVEQIHTYDAYGREGLAPHLGRFGYAGGIELPEAGAVHMRARVYDPVQGRFISADPIGYQGGINLYAYGAGDPVNFVDPSGLAPDEYVTPIDPVYQGLISTPGGDITVTGCKSCILQQALDYLGLHTISRALNEATLPGDGAGAGPSSRTAKSMMNKVRKNCGTPPPSPPGVSANKNMGLAQYMSSHHGIAYNLSFMLSSFPTGASMEKGGNQYVAFGNFNYGSFATALGLSYYSTIGAAQFQSLYSHQQFDQVVDQTNIKKGIAYAQCMLSN